MSTLKFLYYIGKDKETRTITTSKQLILRPFRSVTLNYGSIISLNEEVSNFDLRQNDRSHIRKEVEYLIKKEG